jgi:hypothetical protein
MVYGKLALISLPQPLAPSLLVPSRGRDFYPRFVPRLKSRVRGSYLAEPFHCFDAFVIVGSFAIDLLEHGSLEEIASLIVVLRLWRFVKIVEEFSLEASEQSEDLRQRIADLEKQNSDLKARLRQQAASSDRDGSGEAPA